MLPVAVDEVAVVTVVAVVIDAAVVVVTDTATTIDDSAKAGGGNDCGDFDAGDVGVAVRLCPVKSDDASSVHRCNGLLLLLLQSSSLLFKVSRLEEIFLDLKRFVAGGCELKSKGDAVIVFSPSNRLSCPLCVVVFP